MLPRMSMLGAQKLHFDVDVKVDSPMLKHIVAKFGLFCIRRPYPEDFVVILLHVIVENSDTQPLIFAFE